MNQEAGNRTDCTVMTTGSIGLLFSFKLFIKAVNEV